jgi:hypothetical protein
MARSTRTTATSETGTRGERLMRLSHALGSSPIEMTPEMVALLPHGDPVLDRPFWYHGEVVAMKQYILDGRISAGPQMIVMRWAERDDWRAERLTIPCSEATPLNGEERTQLVREEGAPNYRCKLHGDLFPDEDPVRVPTDFAIDPVSLGGARSYCHRCDSEQVRRYHEAIAPLESKRFKLIDKRLRFHGGPSSEELALEDEIGQLLRQHLSHRGKV